MVATLERQAKKGQLILLFIRREDVSYPYFGERLDRRVELPVNGRATHADWVVVAPTVLFPPGNTPVVDRHGWRLFRT